MGIIDQNCPPDPSNAAAGTDAAPAAALCSAAEHAAAQGDVPREAWRDLPDHPAELLNRLRPPAAPAVAGGPIVDWKADGLRFEYTWTAGDWTVLMVRDNEARPDSVFCAWNMSDGIRACWLTDLETRKFLRGGDDIRPGWPDDPGSVPALEA